MFGFATWNLPMLVLESSDIHTYEDLAGKRVGLSPVGSSTAAVLQMVFDAYGLTDSITIENYTWGEGYGALKDGRIDAFVGSWTTGNPISGIIELEATNKIRVLDMDPAIGEAAHEIALRSRGTPRIANGLLRRVRDFAMVKGSGSIDPEIARYALEALNIDRYGLDEIDNKILATIITKFRGGPVGLSTIATALGEDPGTIEDVYEPFLIKEGFLQRTPRGREVTDLAWRHLGLTRPDYGGLF